MKSKMRWRHRWFWYILATQGKIPEIKIGNVKIPLIPGMGICKWLIFQKFLANQENNKDINKENKN